MEMTATSQDRDGYNISLNYRAGTIRIYKQAIEVLGNPRFVQFYIRSDEKLIYMLGTDERAKSALEVPNKEELRDRCYELYGLHLIRWISRIAGWDLERPHILRGNFIPKYNAISFDLTKALSS